MVLLLHNDGNIFIFRITGLLYKGGGGGGGGGYGRCWITLSNGQYEIIKSECRLIGLIASFVFVIFSLIFVDLILRHTCVTNSVWFQMMYSHKVIIRTCRHVSCAFMSGVSHISHAPYFVWHRNFNVYVLWRWYSFPIEVANIICNSWVRYLIRVINVARLPACVTITATSSGGLS